jgi:hypothetical protein
MEFRAGGVDDDFLLLYRHLELDNLRARLGRLFVGVDIGRGDQFDFLARQFQIVCRSCHSRCGHHQRRDSGAH